MGNRLTRLQGWCIVASVLLLYIPGCLKNSGWIDQPYSASTTETLSADADAAASLASTVLPGKADKPKPGPGPKPKPNGPVKCERCDGTGRLFGDGRIRPICPDCKGTGKLNVSAAVSYPSEEEMPSATQLLEKITVAEREPDNIDTAEKLSQDIAMNLDKLGDRLVTSIEDSALKLRASYGDLELTTERLVNAQLPDAWPKDMKASTQREPENLTEKTPVRLIVGVKKDSAEHKSFHSAVLPNLPNTWTVHYAFYAENKKLANNLLPKMLLRSGLRICTLVGKSTADQLLTTAYSDTFPMSSAAKTQLLTTPPESKQP